MVVTAKYFMKTPPAGIIEYSLSMRAILVEGPSEYMLLDRFYKQVIEHTPEDDGVSIIDIRGLNFKRYLEIAVLTGSKIAVITDNDKDWQSAYGSGSFIRLTGGKDRAGPGCVLLL